MKHNHEEAPNISQEPTVITKNNEKVNIDSIDHQTTVQNNVSDVVQQVVTDAKTAILEVMKRFEIEVPPLAKLQKRTFFRTFPLSVVLWGDSITQYGDKADGWVNILRKTFKETALFYNLGIMAINTEAYLAMTRSIQFQNMMPKRVSHIFIGLGANDAAYGLESSMCQGVHPDIYKKNLKLLITEAKEYTNNITVIVPTPITKFDSRSATKTDAYATAATEVVSEGQGEFLTVKLAGIDIRHKIPGKVEVCDGLHLNITSNKVLAEMVGAQITQGKQIDSWVK